jgi:hypothetical protein
MKVESEPFDILLKSKNAAEENLNESWYEVELIFSANILSNAYKGKKKNFLAK